MTEPVVDGPPGSDSTNSNDEASTDAARAKRRLVEVFTPSDRGWRVACLRQGLEIVGRALGARRAVESSPSPSAQADPGASSGVRRSRPQVRDGAAEALGWRRVTPEDGDTSQKSRDS